MKRSEIYKKIDTERDYQELRWGVRKYNNDIPDEKKPVSEWLNYMEFHILKAKEGIYHLNKDEALSEIRKVVALGVRALEIHGCPDRVIQENLINDSSSDQ